MLGLVGIPTWPGYVWRRLYWRFRSDAKDVPCGT